MFPGSADKKEIVANNENDLFIGLFPQSIHKGYPRELTQLTQIKIKRSVFSPNGIRGEIVI